MENLEKEAGKGEASHSSHFIADGVLLVVSMFWGSSFAIIKEALNATSPANFLFIRFAFACILLLPIAWGRGGSSSREFLKPGLFVGLLLFGAFLTQAWGLVYTSASRSGFITGLSVIFVPLLSIFILRQIPGRLAMVGAVLAFAGLYLLAAVDQSQGLPFNIGDVLTLLGALLWAGHILALGYYSPRVDTFWLTFLQLGVAGVGAFLWAGFTGALNVRLSRDVFCAALYLAVFCTILAYLGQTWAQTRTTTIRTAIILTTEPVFAALFAGWWLNEQLGLWGWLGAGWIIGGILLAELKAQNWSTVYGRWSTVIRSHGSSNPH